MAFRSDDNQVGRVRRDVVKRMPMAPTTRQNSSAISQRAYCHEHLARKRGYGHVRTAIEEFADMPNQASPKIRMSRQVIAENLLDAKQSGNKQGRIASGLVGYFS